jgi:hypothetical protein
MQISSAWVDQASYPDVPSEIPVVRFDEAQRMIEASTDGQRSASRTFPQWTNPSSENGLTWSTAPTSFS